MTDPKRWLDEAPPEAIEHLLRAAASERPTEQSLARTLTVLGVGVGASGAAATAGAATAGAAATSGAVSGGALGAAAGVKATGVILTSSLVKWGAVVTALAVTGVAGKAVLSHARGPASHDGGAATVLSSVVPAPKRVEVGADVRSNTPLAAAPNVADAPNPAAPDAPNPAQPSPAKSAPKARPGAPAPRPAIETPPADAERLAEEVALVDRARGALARGDATDALAALDEYDARFARRKFAPEALYLRMEAQLRAGRPEAARAVAEALANGYPTSPHAARARQVLGRTIP